MWVKNDFDFILDGVVVGQDFFFFNNHLHVEMTTRISWMMCFAVTTGTMNLNRDIVSFVTE